MQRVAHSILSGRILLHLRQAASQRIITSRHRGDIDHPSTFHQHSSAPVSADWKFRRQGDGDGGGREGRSLIDTVRDEIRDDTATWFGTEGVLSTSSGSAEEIHSELEMDTGIQERERYTYSYRGMTSVLDEGVDEPVRNGRVKIFTPEEESHLDM